MQTFGTWLQLTGAIITLGGLVWAWRKTSGRVDQWRDAMSDWYVQMLESIATRLTPPPAAPGGPGTLSVTLPKPTMQAVGSVNSGTDEQRLARLETENARRADEIREAAAALRIEIDQAVADALRTVQADANTVRLHDIYPALFGILVSIAGYVCQLWIIG